MAIFNSELLVYQRVMLGMLGLYLQGNIGLHTVLKLSRVLTF